MARKTVVNGAVVRAWLSENGQAVGSRGRFSQGQIDAFEDANPGQKYGVGHVEPRKITGVRINAESGRKTPVTVKATLPEVRAWAQAQPGIQVGAKGRISDSVLAAFAARPKA